MRPWKLEADVKGTGVGDVRCNETHVFHFLERQRDAVSSAPLTQGEARARLDEPQNRFTFLRPQRDKVREDANDAPSTDPAGLVVGAQDGAQIRPAGRCRAVEEVGDLDEAVESVAKELMMSVDDKRFAEPRL